MKRQYPKNRKMMNARMFSVIFDAFYFSKKDVPLWQVEAAQAAADELTKFVQNSYRRRKRS